MDARMLYLYALTPVHSGTGQAAGTIDLPVAREKVVNWPYLPGSSLKGVFRDACRPAGPARTWREQDADPAWQAFYAAFGPDTTNASEAAGSLLFADGRLLCLPVRSYRGTFAWVSCPLALQRWQRDVASAGLAFSLGAPPTVAEGNALVTTGSALVLGEQVYLEDLDLAAVTDPAVDAWASAIADAALDSDWRGQFRTRFAVVADDVFTFLTETGTDVVARIKLNEETKTVACGALWYEEAIPSEAIFTAPLLAAPRNGASADALFGLVERAATSVLQIGGNATVGRGLVQARLGAGVGS